MAHSMALLLLIGVFVPLVAFVVLAFFGARLGKPRAGYVAVAGIGISFLCSTVVLLMWLKNPQPGVVNFLEPWAYLGTVPINFGVNLDALTVIMFFMVTLVSTCIFVFSLGYMSGHSDEVDGQCKYHRFFTYLSLFAFSMLGLVVAPSILFLFIFWELVGVCSYFLIGFYFHKKSASDAAIKAFVVNRVGDFGFLIGLMMVFFYLGDVSLDGAAERFREQAELGGGPLFELGPLGLCTMATWMGIFLFCGAIGKSAQVPLQVWLPDAMEGPTPVSALIHAATMVAAGVYLVARIFTLLTPGASMFIATIGCITLTMAALIAIVQTDIKRVLAYSTLSQLGYMIFGLGVGAWIGAMFHLLTHAFFKAMMFLGSGQVIEGCHHEQDMTKMGGLRHKMPVTCWTFFIGVLAIAGTGIPGIGLGIGGYFSKDEILAVAWHRVYGHDAAHHAAAAADDGAMMTLAKADTTGHTETKTDAGHGHAAAGFESEHLPWYLFWFPVLIAYVTPFYMMRCWWMTFMGKPRDQHIYDHAHESKLMYLPLIVLAVGTVFASYWLFRPLVAEAAPTAVLSQAFDGHASDLEHAHGTLIDHGAHSAMIVYVGFAFAIGFGIAYAIYKNGLSVAERLKAKLAPVHKVLWHKFYFDEVYNTVFVYGVSRVLAVISGWIDLYVVDGLVNLSGWVTRVVADVSGNRMDAGGMLNSPKQTRIRDLLMTIILIASAYLIWDRFAPGNYVIAMWIGVVVWLLVLGVDGLVNDLGGMAWGLGGLLRRPHSGNIRTYVILAAGAAAVAIIVILTLGNQTAVAVELMAR